VEYFRAVAARAPWLADAGGWFFDCLEGAVPAVVADLLSPNGTCGLAGFPIGQGGSNARRGLPVGHTLTRNGYSVVVLRREAPAGIWSPFAAFTWQMWLLFGSSMPVVGVLLFVVDALAVRVEAANARRAAGRGGGGGGGGADAAGAAGHGRPPCSARVGDGDGGGGGPEQRRSAQARPKRRALAWLLGETAEEREASKER
jgi:hypothetical protein